MKRKETFTRDKITDEIIEGFKSRHDFQYIKDNFFKLNYKPHDLTKDLLEIFSYNQDLSQISAVGPMTTRVTNYYVMETQCKATSIRALMSPYRAIQDDKSLCQIFHRIESSPHFFTRRAEVEKALSKRGLTSDILTLDTEGMSDIQKEAIKDQQDFYIESLNKADLDEVRRAVSHIPSFHKVSQFPNHAAAKIYERYAPIENGIILDSSSGWGNRLMATLTSKYHYKYLGTDPNSEMHNNYRGIADLVYKVCYEGHTNRKYPEDFFDIRDQGSELDIPEWHNNSGYIIDEKAGTITNKFTNEVYQLNNKLHCNQFIKDDIDVLPSGEEVKYHWEHPTKEGYGINDTGTLHTTGQKLPPIWQTHDHEVFNSGIGDLSFTSPPYFFLETYTESSHSGDTSDGQSAGKHSLYTDWIHDFVYPTIVNHFNYLKPGGYYVFNLKDLPADNLYIYSDWLSACLDVGFELIEQPELILKSRRQFGKNAEHKDKINFKGGTERIGVLRKPLTPDTPSITKESKDALYHIQNNFTYPLLKMCRPKEFTSHLPEAVEQFLENKFKGKIYKYEQKRSFDIVDDSDELEESDED